MSYLINCLESQTAPENWWRGPAKEIEAGEEEREETEIDLHMWLLKSWLRNLLYTCVKSSGFAPPQVPWDVEERLEHPAASLWKPVNKKLA